MTAEAALAVSDDELGVLWAIAGRPLFGYAPLRELDGAAWDAVVRGLVARGFVRGDDPLAMPRTSSGCWAWRRRSRWRNGLRHRALASP